jgi:hypothetical protein
MKLPRYEFKALEELAWFVLVAVMTVLFQTLAEFDPSRIEDWRTWFVALGAAMVRAGAGAALAWLTRRGVTREP